MQHHYTKYSFRSTVEISGAKVGGLHSQIPTTLIGSIFYMRHKIVRDDVTGDFDEIAAASLVEKCLNYVENLGIGFMLDVIGNTPKALVRYVKFLRKISPTPILINSTLPEPRIQAARELASAGLTDNIVYNSINPFNSPEEIKMLAELPINTAVVQAYNAKSKKSDGPLKALVGSSGRDGLLDQAFAAGMTQIMVDIPILDLSSVGLIPQQAKNIVEVLSVPVGSAPSNATFTNEWLRNRDQVSLEQFRMLNAVVNSYLAAQGCNFLFFGPIEGAQYVFPACAIVDAVNVYGARSSGISPDSENHPIFKIL